MSDVPHEPNPAAVGFAWYMFDEPEDRVLAFEWWPAVEGPIRETTRGTLYAKTRLDSREPWGALQTVCSLPCAMARQLAKTNGFHVEVPKL